MRQQLCYCRIQPDGLYYDAERNLLAIAKFLIFFFVVLFCFPY